MQVYTVLHVHQVALRDRRYGQGANRRLHQTLGFSPEPETSLDSLGSFGTKNMRSKNPVIRPDHDSKVPHVPDSWSDQAGYERLYP